MLNKNKIFIALVFVLTLVVSSVSFSPSVANAESMHVPDGVNITHYVNILNLYKKTNGFLEGTRYTGQYQCRGFANKVYNKLFGLSGVSGYTGDNYGATNYPGSHIVGQLKNFGANDANAMKNLFLEVKPGSIVQMGRRGKLNSTKTAAAPHTAIFFYVPSNESGCYFYEANTDGKNTIKVNFYTWAQLAQKNQGFTIYEPNNYQMR